MTTNKHRFTAAAMLVVSLGVAGCGASHNPEDISKAGFAPVATPDTTLTCYDYNGDMTLQEKPTDGTMFRSYEVEAKYKEGKPTHVLGGGSCASQEFYFNVNDRDSAARFDQAGKIAPYFAVVTNGVDKVLLSGRFTDVTVGSDGVMTLKLEQNGVLLHKMTVSGLQTTVTAQRGTVPDTIANPQPAAP